MGYDVKRICDDVAPEVIAIALGIETKRYGKRVSILCPEHNDTHFGSCYLTERGFKCFACGASGDSVRLVQVVQGCSFVDACQFIVDAAGGSIDSYKQTGEPKFSRVLDNQSLKAIGLAPNGSCRLTRLIKIVSQDYPIDDTTRADWHTSLDAEGYYALMETEPSTALAHLLRKDEALYKQVILAAACESLDNYTSFEKMLKFSAADNEQARIIRKAADTVGVTNLLRAIQEAQRICQDIIIEFGDGKAKKISSPKSVFGKIGGVSL